MRLSWACLSGSIQASHIGAPQRLHFGSADSNCVCCMIAPFLGRRERWSVSQSPAPTDRASAGDDVSVGFSPDKVCSKLNTFDWSARLTFCILTSIIHETQWQMARCLPDHAGTSVSTEAAGLGVRKPSWLLALFRAIGTRHLGAGYARGKHSSAVGNQKSSTAMTGFGGASSNLKFDK